MPTFYLGGDLVHFAAFADHVGFFPGPSGIAAFQYALRGFEGAKGAMQFPHAQPLLLALVGEIVDFRVAENRQPRARRKRA